MATKRVRNGKFQYIVKNKKLLPKPLHFTFENEAEGDDYVVDLERMLSQGIVPHGLQSANKSIKLHALIDEYIKSKALKPYARDLLEIQRKRLANIDVSQITYKWSQAWIRDMKYNYKLTPGTINKHVGVLARCLDWAINASYVDTNPLRKLETGFAEYNEHDQRLAGIQRINTERDRRLEDGEETQILAVIKGDYEIKDNQRALELDDPVAYRTLFLLALETAMRMRELYTLDLAQVDFDKRTIFLKKTKNGDSRQVPMTKPALVLLRDFIDSTNPTQFVFHWFDGKYSEIALRKTTNRLSRQWKRIFEHACCEDLTFHDIRHEATSRFYERTTLSDIEIAKITGHKTLKTLMRYANLRGSNLAGKLW